MPLLAVFPKGWIDPLCVDGTLSLRQWIEMTAPLDIEGLEFYPGMIDLQDPSQWSSYRHMVEDQGRSIPMLCCSPDFTHPDPGFRAHQVDLEKSWIDLTVALGGQYCRILSGQRRPGITRDQGLNYSAECIEACLPHAAAAGITLIIENHYKDGYWRYPEFAQPMDLFCELIGRIDSPNFAVNYDPSNTLLAGEDPLELLRRVKHRVRTMHASDRYLLKGSFADLRREELDSVGYAQRLHHGEIGQGANDYDAIFTELKSVGFDGWVSIEDGVDGFEQLRRSVTFVRQKITQHWPKP